ncbi:MAG: hypothetical protein OWU32_10665 [Firmicutes bacterium]|nr:hypothetical protein [Bacillota bacterium]
MKIKPRRTGFVRQFVTGFAAIVCFARLACPAQAEVMDITLQTRPLQGVVIAARSGPRLVVELYSPAGFDRIVRGVATVGFTSRDRLVVLGVPEPVVNRWSQTPFVRSAQVYVAPMCFDHAQVHQWQRAGSFLKHDGAGDRGRESGEMVSVAPLRVLGATAVTVPGIGDMSLSPLHGEGRERVGYAMLRVQTLSVSAGILYPAYRLRDDAPIRADELLVFAPTVLPAFADSRLLRQLDPDVAIVLSRRQDLQQNEKWETALETLRELWIDVYTVEGRALVIAVGPHGMLLPSMRSVR